MKLEDKDLLLSDIVKKMIELEDVWFLKLSEEIKKMIDEKQYLKVKLIAEKLDKIPEITNLLQTELSAILLLIDPD